MEYPKGPLLPPAPYPIGPPIVAHYETPKGKVRMALGDVVCWTPLFLASIGCRPTDPMWRERGTITALLDSFVRVDWGNREQNVNPFNIAKPLSARGTDVPIWYNERINGRKYR